MPDGAVEAVRSGAWRDVRPRPLAYLATVAALGDVTTTLLVLLHGQELNSWLQFLAAVHPAIAMAYFLLYTGALTAVTWLSFGWLSTFCGVYLVGVMGMAALNNLLLWTGAIDVSLYALAPLEEAVVFGAVGPVVAVLALAAAWRLHGIPPRELAGLAAYVIVTAGASHVLV